MDSQTPPLPGSADGTPGGQALPQWDLDLVNSSRLAIQRWTDAKTRFRKGYISARQSCTDPETAVLNKPSFDAQKAALRIACNDEISLVAHGLSQVIAAALALGAREQDEHVLYAKACLAQAYLHCEEFGKAEKEYAQALRVWKEITPLHGGEVLDGELDCRSGLARAWMGAAGTRPDPQSTRVQALQLVMQNLKDRAQRGCFEASKGDVRLCDTLVITIIHDTDGDVDATVDESSGATYWSYVDTLQRTADCLDTNVPGAEAMLTLLLLQVKIRMVQLLAVNLKAWGRAREVHAEMSEIRKHPSLRLEDIEDENMRDAVESTLADLEYWDGNLSLEMYEYLRRQRADQMWSTIMTVIRVLSQWKDRYQRTANTHKDADRAPSPNICSTSSLEKGEPRGENENKHEGETGHRPETMPGANSQPKGVARHVGTPGSTEDAADGRVQYKPGLADDAPLAEDARHKESRLIEEALAAVGLQRKDDARRKEKARLAAEDDARRAAEDDVRRVAEDDARRKEKARLAAKDDVRRATEDDARRKEKARLAAKDARHKEARLIEEALAAVGLQRKDDARRKEKARRAEELRLKEEARLIEAQAAEDLQRTEDARRKEKARLAEEGRLREEARVAERRLEQQDQIALTSSEGLGRKLDAPLELAGSLSRSDTGLTETLSDEDEVGDENGGRRGSNTGSGALFDASHTEHSRLGSEWMRRMKCFSKLTLASTEASCLLGARVTVIDTGICADHPRISRVWSAKGGQVAGKPCRFRDFSEIKPSDDQGGEQARADLDTPVDEDGHGTFIAGLLLSLVPGVELSIARIGKTRKTIQDDDPEHLSYRVGKAIEYAVDVWKAEIISISFGCQKSHVATDALKKAAYEGVIVFAATGNSGNTKTPFPASEDGVFKIYSCTAFAKEDETTGTPSDTHNSFHTLGRDIESLWPSHLAENVGGKEGKQVLKCKSSRNPRDTWTVMSGTSFATPIAAAMVAIIYQFYRAHEEEIKLRLKKTADKLTTISSVRHILKYMSTKAGGTNPIFYLHPPGPEMGSTFFFEPDERLGKAGDSKNVYGLTYEAFLIIRLCEAINGDYRR